MAKRDITGLMSDKIKPQGAIGSKTTKTTITFDKEDEKEIYRIQDELQAKGIRVKETTQTIRLALRIAFAEKSDDELYEVHRALAEKWKRGG
jgi:hypothetical protein